VLKFSSWAKDGAEEFSVNPATVRTAPLPHAPPSKSVEKRSNPTQAAASVSFHEVGVGRASFCSNQLALETISCGFH
jgi:hypothetical protein